MVETPGEPYRPSNSSEGESFAERFCYRCRFESEDDPCDIATNAFVYVIGDPEYPHEWVHDAKGCPTCTAFSRSEAPDASSS